VDPALEFPPTPDDTTATLEPGRYHILVGGLTVAPAEAAVMVAPEAAWDALVPRVPELLAPSPPPEPGGPLAVERGLTPEDEPLPETAIDRLVLLELEPGRVAAARVTLHAACFGTMARLRADHPHQPPVLDEARTCTTREAAREPLAPFPLGSNLELPPSSALLGTFVADEPCDGAGDGTAVCVPGGSFLLGDHNLPGNGDAEIEPERVAVMSRFWIDRAEVTQTDLRAAVEQGFVPTVEPLAGDTAWFPYIVESPASPSACTAAAEITYPEGAEAPGLPLNCVGWSTARAYCRYRGGDLPTAAQWEYVATAAGRSAETAFPWGDDPPVCEVGDCTGATGPCHAADTQSFDACRPEPLGPAFGSPPAASAEHADPEHGDASVPLGEHPSSVVFALAGGVRELTLDAFHPYDAPCWRATTLRDPRCFEPEPVQVELRGGAWAEPLPDSLGVSRSRAVGGEVLATGCVCGNSLCERACGEDTTPDEVSACEEDCGPDAPRFVEPTVGFRCVYEEPP
jgi:formylglycine-generating enzyme required for sulfatase activity